VSPFGAFGKSLMMTLSGNYEQSALMSGTSKVFPTGKRPILLHIRAVVLAENIGLACSDSASVVVTPGPHQSYIPVDGHRVTEKSIID
jgi:hypothetical protein